MSELGPDAKGSSWRVSIIFTMCMYARKTLIVSFNSVRNTTLTAIGGALGAYLDAVFVMEWAKPEVPFGHIDIAGAAGESPAARPSRRAL
jgi:leucyl aminopeptidase